MTDSGPKAHSPGPLRRLAAGVLGLVSSHLGIFSIEVEEAGEWLLKALVLAVLGAGSILLFLLAAALALILMVDPAYRLNVAMGLSAFFLLFGGVCVVVAWRWVSRGPRPFAATLEQLRRDKERLLP